MIGTRIAQFEITAKLGEGGMGEVYRATDTRLDREVALKVLPEAFVSDPDRLGRFQREAKVLASLNHPHIAGIYEVGEAEAPPSGGGSEKAPRPRPETAVPTSDPGSMASPAKVHYLVMELAEGETLAARLERGPMPMEETLRLAIQIAEALEAAHARGIVHRDLKPANVMIVEGEQVKVLDFGLAKALEPDPGTDDTASRLANSPTLTAAATLHGVILGSAAYMSPEQAKGLPVDEQADIWAFGVVVYEMLKGQRLFQGDSVPDTLAGVLKTDIALHELPPGTPKGLRRLLGRCLERNARNRLHDIADARIALQDVVADLTQAETPAEAKPAFPSRRHPVPAWAVGLLALVATAGLAAWLGYRFAGERAEPPRSAHLGIHLADDQTLDVGGNSVLAFSPDGNSLVFPGRLEGRDVLFRRDLGSPETVAIPGTEDGAAPFFSPDGKWIGFVQNGFLMKIPVDGGRPFRLAEARGAGGSTWMDEETIIFAPIYSDGLFRVSTAGGEPERLTTPDRTQGELGHWWPDPLPDHRHLLFTAFRTPVDTSRVGVLDLETGKIEWVVEGGFFGRYVATGHLLYATGTRLYAMPFDAELARPTGPAVALVDDVAVAQTGGYAMAAVSSRGDLAYVRDSLGIPPREVVWIDRAGRIAPAMAEKERFLSVALSPDDGRAALTIQGESQDLWVYSFDSGILSRLTTGADTEFDPAWTADGDELVYVVDTPPFELHRIRVGSPDEGRPVWDEPAELDTTAPAPSPDGRLLAYEVTEPQTGENVYVRPLDGSEPTRAIRATRASEQKPDFSPDGRWIVYESTETGRSEIYVEPVSGKGERTQISADGGVEARWAETGEIFYRHDDEFRAVATQTGDRFTFQPFRSLFREGVVSSASVDANTWDVTRDGERILAIVIPPEDRPRQVELVTNWAQELRTRVPGARD